MGPIKLSDLPAAEFASSFARQPIALPMKIDAKIQHVGAGSDVDLFAQPIFKQMFDRIGARCHTVSIAPESSRSEGWRESTCLGIARALRETAVTYPPSKPLMDAVERATVALIDLNKALGNTEQDGWEEHDWLEESSVSMSLTGECVNAARESVPLTLILLACGRACEAVAAALYEIDNAAEGEVVR